MNNKSQLILSWVRAYWGEWCWWPTDTNSQTSLSPWVCPIALEFCSRENFGDFICRYVAHVNLFFSFSLMDTTRWQFQHQPKTIGSYFCNVWYNEDIIMGLYIYNLHSVWYCEHISSLQMFFHTYVASLWIQNDILHWFLKKPL